ncbi:MAG: hypothetical protein IT368_00895 [Candidatus Hydrogenedentes bacterium]|nr:hypothetical protein [Candidatus Hydrogenedentota bacterium]
MSPSAIVNLSRLLTAAMLLLLLALPTAAESEPKAIPSLIHFQARLTDPATGAPREGTFMVTFSLYDSKTAVSPLWSESKFLNVSGGLLQTSLGDTVVLPKELFTGGSLWVGVTVEPDPEAKPRQRLTPVPFALNSTYLGGKAAADYAPALHEHDAADLGSGTLDDARIPTSIARETNVFGLVAGADGSGSGLDADLLDGLDSGAFALNGHDHTGVYLNKVGPDTMSANSPEPVLQVNQAGPGPAGEFTALDQDGIVGTTGALSGIGSGVHGVATLSGLSTGSQQGVLGESLNGMGVTAISQNGFGIWAMSAGSIGIVSSGVGNAVRGTTDTPSGDAIYGLNTADSGASWGLRGESASPDGRGVSGYNYSTTGDSVGVAGISSSTTGVGVWGTISPVTGEGIGVKGTTSSSAGIGVLGQVTSDTGNATGVKGISAAASGSGVTGLATESAGANAGVYGQSDSAYGYGVHGYCSNAGGTPTGVYGAADAPNGRGVRGDSPYVGVWGQATGDSGLKWAVYGYCASPTGYAGSFPGTTRVDGNLDVSGTLTKGSGTFKIDHPLDPENKYLSHSFVESPDMMNVYNGNVVLDAAGEATVMLPGYFEALNRDFRYQLTPIGGAAPNLHVAAKIAENAFRIAGGSPGLEVSWQVTGIRQDPFAQDHPVEVEQDKPEAERGTYLYPEGYGQPAEKSVGHALSPGEPE